MHPINHVAECEKAAKFLKLPGTSVTDQISDVPRPEGCFLDLKLVPDKYFTFTNGVDHVSFSTSPANKGKGAETTSTLPVCRTDGDWVDAFCGSERGHRWGAATASNVGNCKYSAGRGSMGRCIKTRQPICAKNGQLNCLPAARLFVGLRLAISMTRTDALYLSLAT
jgi:hypothetical protein